MNKRRPHEPSRTITLPNPHLHSLNATKSIPHTCKPTSDSEIKCIVSVCREHRSGLRVGLHNNNLLLRSCTVRNTETVVGIVVYAGESKHTLRVYTLRVYTLPTWGSAL